jgi:hypothetical protein
MTHISREQFLDVLANVWGKYIERFQRLSPAQQADFLKQQGYATLADLLAHIVAWWQDGRAMVLKMLADPALQNPDYDVDVFNAQAVARFAELGQAKMIELYETERRGMAALVESLSDTELADERINTRLYYEIISHSQEHALKIE